MQKTKNGSQRFHFHIIPLPTFLHYRISESLLSGENENSIRFRFTKLNVKAYLLRSLSKIKSKPLMQKEG